jgi:DNA-directed RNA polymerase specialized sigma24 family protein
MATAILLPAIKKASAPESEAERNERIGRERNGQWLEFEHLTIFQLNNGDWEVEFEDGIGGVLTESKPTEWRYRPYEEDNDAIHVVEIHSELTQDERSDIKRAIKKLENALLYGDDEGGKSEVTTNDFYSLSPSASLIQQSKDELFPYESNRIRLDGPEVEGIEKGRLNRLYQAWAADKSEENLNALLADVERYARRVTRGRGGKFREYLHQAPGDEYPMSELSTAVQTKVWQRLGTYDPAKSKFSTWVFAVARNALKDATSKIARRAECEFFEWKGYDGDPTIRKVGPEGTAPDSFTSTTNSGFVIADNGATRGGGGGGVASRANSSDSEPELEALSKQDRAIWELIQKGSSLAHISELFGRGRDERWAYKRLLYIRKRLGLDYELYNPDWEYENYWGMWSGLLDVLLRGVPKQDQKIIELVREGETPKTIGKLLKRNAKWVSNQLTRIKTTLKKLANEHFAPVLVIEQERFQRRQGDRRVSALFKRIKEPTS